MFKSVTNPTAGDVHVNRPLTNFSQKYLLSSAMFVALRAFPNIAVSKQSDLYYVFDREDFLRDEAEERADGTESAGGGFDLSTEPYFARVYAYHKDVTDRQRANQDDQIQLDQSASQFVTQKLLIRRERLFVTKFMGTGIWDNELVGAASSPGAGEFLKWSAAASDPVKDIRDAKRTIHAMTGYRPNKMLIGREAFDTLVDNDGILARVIGGATTDIPAMALKKLLAELFELEEIFVMDGVANTSKKGAATQVTGLIGGDNALLYYAPNVATLGEPTAAAQFSWNGLMGNTDAGLRIKRFRMEPIESDRIEGQMAFDYRLTGAALGFYFSDCV